MTPDEGTSGPARDWGVSIVGLKHGPGLRDGLHLLADSFSERGSTTVAYGGSLEVPPDSQVRYVDTGAGQTLLSMGSGAMIERASGAIASRLRKVAEAHYFWAPHLANSEVARNLQRGSQVVVSHIHDPVPHTGQRFSSIVRRAQARLLRHSDAAVAFGDAVAQQIRATYAFDRPILTVPHPAYLQRPDVVPGRTERKYVTFQGRLQEYKGLDDFIEAIETLGPLPHVTPLILTPDQMRQSDRRRCSAAGIQVIERYMEPNELLQFLQQSVIGVLPYRDATQTGVAPNFFAAGVPVISTDVGGLDEVINDSRGRLIRPRAIAALAAAIEELTANQSEWVRLSNGAVGYHDESLSWRSMSLRFEDLVGPLLESGPQARQ